jgi:lysophospholipase L1-like esterase
MLTRSDLIRPGLFGHAVAADNRRLEFDYKNEVIVRNAVPVDVVFIGDSITHMWELNAYFGGKGLVLNRGIGGDITEYVLKRFPADVLQLKPKLAVLKIGVNDTGGVWGDAVYGTPGREDAAVVEQIVENITAIVALCREHGQRLALCSILPVHAGLIGNPDRTNAMIMAANARLKPLAGDGVIYVDYHSAMVADDGTTLRDGLAYEGLHPHYAGYNVMAEVLRGTLAEEGIDI